ncbi:hypothetical protein [Haloglomus litoreum]|uniref:hypothetical protein n=1 Tax=Haloglomus litoreum TaxID=3034026 RepID=UPI0023E8DE63|nr:hypothetical protein [Haloglomus sp. DT116]
MVSARTWVDAGRGLAFLLLYGIVATALAPRFHPYTRVAGALVISLGIIAAADVLPRLFRGDRPLLDTDSRLYSVRGLALLTLIILVTAVTADWLRTATTLSESLVTIAGFVVGVIVVLGPVVGYYWRRSATPPG